MKLLLRNGRSKSSSPEKAKPPPKRVSPPPPLQRFPPSPSKNASIRNNHHFTSESTAKHMTPSLSPSSALSLPTSLSSSSSSSLSNSKGLAQLLRESSTTTTTSPMMMMMMMTTSTTTSPRRVLDLETVLQESNDENDAPTEEDDSENDDGVTSERVLFPQPATTSEEEDEGRPTNANLSSIHNSFDIFGSMMNTPSTKKRNSKRSMISPLPTLSEASMEDGSEADPHNNESFDSWDDGDVPFPALEESMAAHHAYNHNHDDNHHPHSPPPAMMKPSAATTNPLVETRKVGPKKNTVAGAPKRTAAEKVRETCQEAADRAARGLEEEAVILYKKALSVGRRDVARIKAQLKEVPIKHHAVAAKSIASRLHEDWMQIGVLIANVRKEQAIIYERLGSYAKAMTCCAEALAVYKRQAKFLKKQAPGTEAAVLAQIKTMLDTTRRIDQAQESYEARKKSHEEIIALRMDLAARTRNPAERKRLYAALHDKITKVRASEAEILGSQHPQLADTSSLLGSLALEQGDKDKAIPYMMEAYAIMKKSLGMKHPRTGMKLLHIASVYNNPLLRKSNLEENLAIDFYNEAISVFKASENCPFLLGSTLNDLAVVLIGRKDFPGAVDMLQQALEAYKAGHERDASVSSWDTAQVWLNLGECHSQQRNFEQASTAFLNGLNVQRDGRKIFENALKHDGTVSGEHIPPAHLVDDRRIADTLRRLGKSYVGAGAYDKAMVFFKEACLIHKNEVKKAVQTNKGRDTNVLPSMQDELAQTIYCMAELNDVTGKTDQAGRLYSESLQLRLFSDAHKPKRTNMVHCAMCLNGLGNIHMKRAEFVEAQGVFKEALGYCSAHGVPSDHPIMQMIEQRFLQAIESAKEKDDDRNSSPAAKEAAQLEQRALVLFEEGKLDAAILTLTSVMQLRKETLKQLRDEGQDSAQAKYTTACTLKIFGQVLARKGDAASAERAFKDSLKLFKKSGTQPTDFIVMQVCEELSKIQQQDEDKIFDR